MYVFPYANLYPGWSAQTTGEMTSPSAEDMVKMDATSDTPVEPVRQVEKMSIIGGLVFLIILLVIFGIV